MEGVSALAGELKLGPTLVVCRARRQAESPDKPLERGDDFS